MKTIKKSAMAGFDEKNDVLITVEPIVAGIELVTPHAAITFLACGLAGVEIKELLRFCAPRLWVLSIISLACGAILGIFAI